MSSWTVISWNVPLNCMFIADSKQSYDRYRDVFLNVKPLTSGLHRRIPLCKSQIRLRDLQSDQSGTAGAVEALFTVRLKHLLNTQQPR